MPLQFLRQPHTTPEIGNMEIESDESDIGYSVSYWSAHFEFPLHFGLLHGHRMGTAEDDLPVGLYAPGLPRLRFLTCLGGGPLDERSFYPSTSLCLSAFHINMENDNSNRHSFHLPLLVSS